MTWSTWQIVALVLGGVGYLSLAGFVWANRQGVGSRPLIVMLMAVKIWSLCYALELSSRTVQMAQWWSGLKYLGIVALPPALWSFVMAYTGRGKLSRRSFRLLMIHPVVVLTVLAVPATHDWIQHYSASPATLLDAPIPSPGWLFWPHAVYTYALMLGADFTLTVRLARIAEPYRRQGALLIAASLLPFVGNLAYNAGWLPQGMIDPTPFLFGVTAIVLVWGFFRLKLLDLTPVARGIVIEQMVDGVLVLDVYGRVADVNAAGAAIVGYPRRAMVGRYAIDVIPGLAPILETADVDPTASALDSEVLVYPTALPDTLPSTLTAGRSNGRLGGPGRTVNLVEGRSNADPDWGSGIEASLEEAFGRNGDLDRDAALPSRILAGAPRDVAVSLTGVTDPVGRQIARLVVLRDVTERNRTERQVRDLLAEQTKLSETLRQSLRPASLPQLPGLRLAARSVPSARGGGVGGDFYDVHSAGEGVSAFVLGDVSGKGVHAAVVTSMARYTVRTLSAQGWSPREVLEQLNRALQTPDDLERFCTVVYGQVRPTTSADVPPPVKPPSRPPAATSTSALAPTSIATPSAATASASTPASAQAAAPASILTADSASATDSSTTASAPAMTATPAPASASASVDRAHRWLAEPILAQHPSSTPGPAEKPEEPVHYGVRLVLTLGGHPPPLLRRRDRSVQPVGRPGTALGLLSDIEVHEVTVDLASGDVLLAYTDGVTEARDGDEQFGEERLAGVLAAVDHDYASYPGEASEDSAATLADAVADAVLVAVQAFSSERDDVALLVLAAT